MNHQLVGTFEEQELCAGELLLRVAPLEPCGNPLCRCRRYTNCVLAFGDPAQDRWLLAQTNYEDEIEEIIEAIGHVHADPMLAMTILFGGPWEVVTRKAPAVMIRQQEACIRLPGRYLEIEPDALREFRGYLNEGDPMQIARLCVLAENFGFDPDDAGGGFHPERLG